MSKAKRQSKPKQTKPKPKPSRKKSNGNGASRHASASAPEREQRECKCKLTGSEMLLRGEQMADAELEIDRLKESRKGINGQIAVLSDTRGKLAQVIEDGEEDRMVDCAWIEDVSQNVFKLVRQDTGTQIDTRAMTASDYQTGLPLEDDSRDGTAEAYAAEPDDTDTAPPPQSAAAARKQKSKATRHAHA